VYKTPLTRIYVTERSIDFIDPSLTVVEVIVKITIRHRGQIVLLHILRIYGNSRSTVRDFTSLDDVVDS